MRGYSEGNLDRPLGRDDVIIRVRFTALAQSHNDNESSCWGTNADPRYKSDVGLHASAAYRLKLAEFHTEAASFRHHSVYHLILIPLLADVLTR